MNNLYFADEQFIEQFESLSIEEKNNIRLDLSTKLNKWNLSYRSGNPEIDDSIFDSAFEFYESKFGHIELDGIENDRRQKLPIIAASMNKVKTLAELRKWAELKKFNFENTEFVITPKYDGITIVKDELSDDAWTKGRDGFGFFVPNHFRLVNSGYTTDKIARNSVYGSNGERQLFVRGEAIMKRAIFEQKYSKHMLGKDGFENPRNLVAGKFNDKSTSDILKDIDFIRFHLDGGKYNYKSTELDALNQINNVKIPYQVINGMEITEELLDELFHTWNVQYEIDGLIIEINSKVYRDNLGFETSTNNPCFARAYKSDSFDAKADTKVVGIKRQISKNGVLNPVIQIEPVRLSGVTISNIYVDNERWLKIYGIGIGSKIEVKRSGGVIPRVSKVEDVQVLGNKEYMKFAKFFNGNNEKTIQESLGILSSNYEPSEEEINNMAKWNDASIEMVLIEMDDEAKIQKLVSFFETIGAEGISDGIVRFLYHKNYTSVKEILSLKPEDMESWDGFGSKKASNIVDSIKKAISEVDLPTLAHASGFFGILGSKKLVLVSKLYDKDWTPTTEELISIEGYSNISASIFIEGFVPFWNFINECDIKINRPIVQEIVGNKMQDKVVVFTGIRDKILESWIEQQGGKIGSSVSKNTHILIMKQIGSGSSKEQKAMDLGIEIETIDSFKLKHQ